MKRSFNSKIFAVALTPFYLYVLIFAYVFVHSEYNTDVFQYYHLLQLLGLIVSAFFFSYRSRLIQWLGLLIFIALGALGIYSGLLVEPVSWSQLIVSAMLIAFGFSLFEVTKYRGRSE